jgi:hypothetical protein
LHFLVLVSLDVIWTPVYECPGNYGYILVHTRIAKLLLKYSSLINTMFPVSWQVTVASNIKGFILTV